MTRWDDQVLAQVESTLARHVGPVASILVRRTARSCDDLPSLLARLADQVTSPTAKAAFLQQTTAQATAAGSGTRRTTAPSGVATTGSTSAGAPIDEAIVARAAKLLAQQVGPIASVLAKRAAARAPNREAFFGALTDAVPDAAARERLRVELARLV